MSRTLRKHFTQPGHSRLRRLGEQSLQLFSGGSCRVRRRESRLAKYHNSHRFGVGNRPTGMQHKEDENSRDRNPSAHRNANHTPLKPPASRASPDATQQEKRFSSAIFGKLAQ